MLKYGLLGMICALAACASESGREANQSTDAALRSLAGLPSAQTYQPLYISRNY